MYGWVRLPGLPYHYYHKSVLRAIGEVIGQVLKIDYNTEGFDKARFARLAVKLDLTKPLVSMIKLDGLTQLVEYEGLPTICYSCGWYGHLEDACTIKAQRAVSSSAPVPRQLDVPHTPASQGPKERAPNERDGQLFGEWMQVLPRHRRQTRAARKDDQGVSHSSERGNNRFNLLATLDSAIEQRNGNPCPTVDAQQHPVSTRRTYTKDTKRGEGAKSTLSNSKSPDKTPVTSTGTSNPKVHPAAAASSVFSSPAYNVTYQRTTLEPEHHTAVILTRQNDTVNNNSEHTGSSWPKPITPRYEGNRAFPPKPPDRTKPKKALQVSPYPKFKVYRPKTKDVLGSPSGKLSKALSNALGHTVDSDDDAAFAEATEAAFDNDSVSDTPLSP